jgi:hypothetical protein
MTCVWVKSAVRAMGSAAGSASIIGSGTSATAGDVRAAGLWLTMQREQSRVSLCRWKATTVPLTKRSTASRPAIQRNVRGELSTWTESSTRKAAPATLLCVAKWFVSVYHRGKASNLAVVV